MAITKEQKGYILNRLDEHNRNPGIKSIVLDKRTNTSIDLIINQGVFASDFMISSGCMARFLYQKQELYYNKNILNIGCGSGVFGVIMSKYGAKSMVLADINPNAVANTNANIRLHRLLDVSVFESDLFSNLPTNRIYDIIIFNHPFFSGEPKKFIGDSNLDEMLIGSMMANRELLKNFFQRASNYLEKNGLIIMPYFHFAGTDNNPAIQSEKHSLQVVQDYRINLQQHMKLGVFSIYLMKPL